MNLQSIVVVVYFIMLNFVLSVTSSESNETSKVVSAVESLEGNKTLKDVHVSEEPLGNRTFKRIYSVSGMTPSDGILEHLEKRLGLTGGEEKLEHVEEALSKIYKALNLDLPVCKDHPVGSKQCLIIQFEGLRNKSKELEIYDALVSLQQLVRMLEDMLQGHFHLIAFEKGITHIKDGLENFTDSVHYLRWKRFFEEAKENVDIIRLRHIFRYNDTVIEDFCRSLDGIFSYTYGQIEATGLFILAMPDVKERLLRCGEKYATEIKIIDVLMRLQVMDEELFVLFTTEGRGHH